MNMEARTHLRPPASPPTKRFFSDVQLRQVAAIFDAIWPGSATNPGARDAGAGDYLSLLLGCDDAVYYEIPAWRPQYVAGLAMLNAVALARPGLGRPLEQLTVPEMTALLKELAAGTLSGFPNADWQRQFFATLRGHAIEGCLADPRWGGNRDGVIWKWLGYPNGQAKEFTR